MTISGHNSLSWPERIKNDIWYIDHWSLWLDLKILFKTIWVIIFTREGFSGRDNVTMDNKDKFKEWNIQK
jgi:lipopolysaccharide/colanic/teichoic acid biosynthesis glycosyltransferase